jgi:hypothetical protein
MVGITRNDRSAGRNTKSQSSPIFNHTFVIDGYSHVTEKTFKKKLKGPKVPVCENWPTAADDSDLQVFGRASVRWAPEPSIELDRRVQQGAYHENQ